MNVILWIDDEREMPEGFSHHARTSQEAIDILESLTEEDTLVLISFDHDLGAPLTSDGKTFEDDARPVVNWMVERGVLPEAVHIHSRNPWGAKWIDDTLRSVPSDKYVPIYRIPFDTRNYK